MAVSEANFVDPLGLFASKRVCPRCHTDSGEIVGIIEKKYDYSGGGSSYSTSGTGNTSSVGKSSRTSKNTGLYFILGGIAYLGVAGGALALMGHVEQFSLGWWLCGLVIVVGIPLYIALAYVTWYATMCVLIIWVLIQIAEHFTNYPH